MPKLSAQKARKRRTTKKSHNNKNSKNVFIIMFLSLITVFGWAGYKVFTSSFVSALSVKSVDPISESFYSFAYVKTDDFVTSASDAKITGINFIFVDIKGKKVINYEIPVNTELDMPGKFGIEKYESLLRIADLTEQDGISLTNAALFKTFAYPVTRYIYIDEAVYKSFDASLWHGSTVRFLTDSYLFANQGLINTNFSSHELYNLIKFISSLPEDRVQKKTLTNSYITQTSLLDSELSDITFKSVISDENKSVALLNGTDIPGVASFGSRVTQNLGGRVVSAENAQNTYEHSILIAKDTQSATVTTLSKIFNISKVIQPSDAGIIDEYVIDRADVTVILGFDVVNAL